jgi:hypothetical protein
MVINPPTHNARPDPNSLMSLIRNYWNNLFSAGPGLVVLGVFFSVLVELGPSKLNQAANKALLGLVDINFILICFIAQVSLTGVVLLVLGSVRTDSKSCKRTLFHYVVNQPFLFIANVVGQAFFIILSVMLSAALFGYEKQAVALVLGLLYYATFSFVSLCLITSTRLETLRCLDKKLEGGRIFALFLIVSAAILYFLVLPIKGS